MTPPATGTALLILVGFVLPGFVAVLLKERPYEVRGEESTFDRLLTTVYYSLLVYLLPVLVVVTLSVSGILDRSGLDQFTSGRSPVWLSGLVGITVLIVLPTLAALGAWQWISSSWRRRLYASSDRLNPEHRTQTSWDFASITTKTFCSSLSSRTGAAWPATTASAVTPATGAVPATSFSRSDGTCRRMTDRSAARQLSATASGSGSAPTRSALWITTL